MNCNSLLPSALKVKGLTEVKHSPLILSLIVNGKTNVMRTQCEFVKL